MIIRPQEGSLLFMTQPDHAVLAAELVTHFAGVAANPRRADIHLADALQRAPVEFLTGVARGGATT